MPRFHGLLIFILLILPAVCQTYTIHTVAGGGLPENTPGPNADLGEVLEKVAVDSNGNLFIPVIQYAVVLRLDAVTGILTRVAGTGVAGYSGAENVPATGVRLDGIVDVAVDANGNLYVAETNSGRIRKVSQGFITTLAGSGSPGFGGDGGPALSAQLSPTAIAVDPSGTVVYVADATYRVRKISNGIITTVAGNGAQGFSGDGGPATSAQLSLPGGLAVDSAGNLYIADTTNGRIRMVAKGIVTTVAGGGSGPTIGDNGPATAALLGNPRGVALDAAGNLYIADAGNGRIRKVSGGTITTIAGGGTALGDNGLGTGAVLAFPEDVGVDTAGDLYFPDGSDILPGRNRISARIRKISGGIISTVAGGGFKTAENGPAASAQIMDPFGVAVDPSDNLYFSDRAGNCVREVSNDLVTTVAGTGSAGFSGDAGTATGAQLSGPEGIAVDRFGNLYIADAGNHRVRKVAGGIISTVAGNGTAGSAGDNGPAINAQLMDPRGLAVDAAGNLYIADHAAHMVRKVSPDGIIHTVAGNGTPGYLGDNGPAISAQLYYPSAVALDAAGNLYIADTFNNFIRKVAPNGIIDTFAGTGKSAADGALSNAFIVQPVSLAFDSAGSLYIGQNGSVRKVATGNISTIAGGLGSTTGYDAPAISAYLPFPSGVAVDSKGVVYVADNIGKTVRSVTRDAPTSVTLTSVLNAASNLQFSVSPGEIIAIKGSGLGPAVLQQAQLNSDGVFGTELAGTVVQVSGVPAPIIYTSSHQVAAVVPYGAGGPNAQVTVKYQGQISAPMTIGWYAWEPGLFTLDESGQGQAAAINQDGSLNSASRPAPRGSIVSLYATGEGFSQPGQEDGKPIVAPYPMPETPVTVIIGGQTLNPEYAGGAPGEIAGMLQINVRIPSSVTPGSAVPLQIRVGQLSQPGTTLAIGN